MKTEKRTFHLIVNKLKIFVMEIVWFVQWIMLPLVCFFFSFFIIKFDIPFLCGLEDFGRLFVIKWNAIAFIMRSSEQVAYDWISVSKFQSLNISGSKLKNRQNAKAICSITIRTMWCRSKKCVNAYKFFM